MVSPVTCTPVRRDDVNDDEDDEENEDDDSNDDSNDDDGNVGEDESEGDLLTTSAFFVPRLVKIRTRGMSSSPPLFAPRFSVSLFRFGYDLRTRWSCRRQKWIHHANPHLDHAQRRYHSSHPRFDR